MSAGPLLRASDVHLAYGQLQALSGVSLEVGEGEVVALVGANGAGKSSLIKGVCGIHPIAAGEVRFAGARIDATPTRDIVTLGVGLVPEGRRIFPSLSVAENIRMGAQLGSPGAWTYGRVMALFPELEEKRALPGTSVSGGQQQMIAIGRALMGNPRLLICDEISLGLAPTIVERLYALLATLAREGLSILVVEQAVRKALAVSDRYHCLLEGRTVLEGRSAEADEALVSQAYFGR